MRLRSRRRTLVVWSSSSGRGARHGVREITRPALSLAGTVITVTGVLLPSEMVLVSGFLVLLAALVLPGPASAPARPCSGRLWAMPLTPFEPSGRQLPPSD